MSKKTYFKLILISSFCSFFKIGEAQQNMDFNKIGNSVYSIMFINNLEIMPKKTKVDVHKATASTFLYNGKLFLACAKHSVENLALSGSQILYGITISKDSIIYQKGIIYYDTTLADVALLKPLTIPDLPKFRYFNNGCIIGKPNKSLQIFSELYLLGYPTYNIGEESFVHYSINPNHRYRPFYKKGYISGYDSSDSSNYKYFLDAYLVKGFSGGPAYYIDLNGRLLLIGIITNTTVANILDSTYNTINNQFQNGGLTIITDAHYLITILKNNNLD